MVFPVLVQAGDLAPVDISLLVGLAVEHVGVHAADGEATVIDPAPVVL
jgi:hypothetical protein